MSEHIHDPARADDALVDWSGKYATQIGPIDRQHKDLVDLINRLYDACRHGCEIDAAFKEAMHEMVEYVRRHFAAEIEFLEKIGYPDPAFSEHKRQHEALIKDILDAARSYGSGGALVPNKFARTLRDWVLSHIAFYDRAYADFVAERRRAGESIEFA
ncbi:MAG: bacteriohemerythrin [Treponema sp.]|nr:bacteriohemerythrin [Treponema sp.]